MPTNFTALAPMKRTRKGPPSHSAPHHKGAEVLSLKAGVARVNLTPPAEMKPAPADTEHAVLAKALVLAQDERNFAVVTADAPFSPLQPCQRNRRPTFQFASRCVN